MDNIFRNKKPSFIPERVLTKNTYNENIENNSYGNLEYLENLRMRREMELNSLIQTRKKANENFINSVII